MAVCATLSVAEASTQSWDVITIGAGPAGAMAARELARGGAKVLLIDKAHFPRTKVCGCCLNRQTLSLLASVGLPDLVRAQGGTSLGEMRIAVSGKQAVVPVTGWVLSRGAFDAALVEAAVEAGAHFLPGTMARLGRVTRDVRTITLRQADEHVEARGRVIVGADGLGGALLAGEPGHRNVIQPYSRLGAGLITEDFPDYFVRGQIFMACARGGYVGLVRLEDGRLNLAAAFDAGFVKHSGGLGHAAAATLRESGFPAISRLENLPWHGTPLLTHQATPPASERVFLLSDAAGYVEPFTGQGIAWALQSGRAVVPLVRQACQAWRPELIGEWSALHERTIVRGQWLCRALARGLRRPFLMQVAVGALARFPAMAGPIVRRLGQ